VTSPLLLHEQFPTKPNKRCEKWPRSTQAQIKDNARQALFLVLSQRVGEVISDLEIERMKCVPSDVLEIGLKDTGFEKEDDQTFLDTEARSLQKLDIPVHDRFRRQSLFRALDRLLSSCTDFQRQLFEVFLSVTSEPTEL
jgi:hypothetical protein